jgi:4'-phosphopantetheinyl transferase
MTSAAPAAVAVTWWPAALERRADGLYVIGVSGDGERETARRQVREALREAVAQLYRLRPGAVTIEGPPGRAPTVSFAGLRGVRAPEISITHDGPWSLAAIHEHGPVGIDIMQAQAIDDWREVARDYLGPQVLAALEAVAPDARPEALARAWTEREARLKCHGKQLGEWTGEPIPADCHTLVLPAGFAGTVAIRAAAG